ncbi:uncharacterized protein LOC108462591 [Gossypium arboreum]|uniref:uncharacterized protein LOC108462591 n=1 Tax=Gossypium arboreum TaxID=29729 RepID=UPI0022F1B605|nr:uncharacterized protein LOC108462591 [Gossypium arboreum]
MNLAPSLHQHHLLYGYYEEREALCDQCNKHIYDRAFTCEICKFWLHAECALQQLPFKISHPSHSQHPLRLIYKDNHPCCNGCSGLSRNWLYRCQPCDFNLDLSCASSTTIPTQIDKKINHFCHHHTLTQFNYRKIKDDHGSTSSLVGGKGTSIGKLMEQAERNAESKIEYFDHEHPLCFKKVVEQNESAICKACFLEISDEAYACKSCEYYIHKTCTNLPWEVLHPLHPQHSLKLLSEFTEKIFSCDGCRDITEGFAYACSMCDFMLDVKCAILRVPKIETQRLKEMEERRPKSCLFNKAHQLSFFNIKAIFDEYYCSFCKRYVKGPAYSCSDCEYLLHESCLGFPREMKLQFHPLHPFQSLLDNSVKICHVCKREIWYYICYSCVQCDLHLHAFCAKSLKRVLKSTSHIHNLYYFEPNIEAERLQYEMQNCGKCRKLLRSNPLCFCMECDTKLHVECALPPSLKSKYHLHPCTLNPGFMEDDSGQNYCDICEEERDPEDHVYYCTECQGHFVAHINCMLNSEEEIAASRRILKYGIGLSKHLRLG